jgi:hypothetical protein
MAGTPKKRARLAQQEAAAAGAAPTPRVDAPLEFADALPSSTQRAPAHTRARERRGGASVPTPGPKAAYLPNVTRVADQHVSSELQQLTQALHASTSVDIERTHPLWCKGWLETYDLQSPDIRELRAYIQSEYGGQLYRISVLNPQGAILYTATLPIAGQPKERGRVITRDDWDPVARQPAAPAAAANGGSGDAGLLRTVVDMMREGQRDQLAAVKDMISSSNDQTRNLISQIVTVRTGEGQRESFGKQLGELVETSKQIDKVRRVFAGPAPKPAEPTAAADDDMDPLLKEAKKAFAQNVVASFMPKQAGAAPAGPQQQQPPPQAPRARHTPPGFRRRPGPAPRTVEEAESIPGFSRTAGHA